MHANGTAQWDVVIVGASFAGTACALAARRAGLRVCVLKRKRDPGLKLHTTGIIVREAAQCDVLCDIPSSLVRRVDRIRLYAPRLHHVDLRSPGGYFLTTDTPNVMRWLYERMRSAGVEVRLMQSFTDAARHRDGWRVDGLGSTRWLVGADGAKSRVAARCGLGHVKDFLYGVEYEFDGAALAEPAALHCFLDRAHAPGYVGWAAQNPNGVQLGLAFRHRASRRGMPDIDGWRRKVAGTLNLSPLLAPTATRAGLIPCGGPIASRVASGVILTGDAAGIVSPVTAGGIHSAWRHGWRVGTAIAAHATGSGSSPERIAFDAAPRFRIKRALRVAFDHLQADWATNLMLASPPVRWAARRVLFGAGKGSGR